MEEQLISFETAKLAKEKGFEPDNYLVADFYKISNRKQYGRHVGFTEEPYDRDIHIAKITQSLLQKWLREKHKIILTIVFEGPWVVSNFTYEIYAPFDHKYASLSTSYEEALEIGLQEALKLIK